MSQYPFCTDVVRCRRPSGLSRDICVCSNSNTSARTVFGQSNPERRPRTSVTCPESWSGVGVKMPLVFSHVPFPHVGFRSGNEMKVASATFLWTLVTYLHRGRRETRYLKPWNHPASSLLVSPPDTVNFRRPPTARILGTMQQFYCILLAYCTLRSYCCQNREAVWARKNR